MKKGILLTVLVIMTISSFGQMKVISGEVNFRTTPAIKENKICKIPNGTVVTLVQDSVEYEDWTLINYNGKIGYVRSDFLKNVSSNSKSYDYSNFSKNGKKYYKNSKEEKVQSPTHSISVPDGATAECNDGTYSFSQSRRGTCSRHGGVKQWLK